MMIMVTTILELTKHISSRKRTYKLILVYNVQVAVMKRIIFSRVDIRGVHSYTSEYLEHMLSKSEVKNKYRR
jgi:hypothetical protein